MDVDRMRGRCQQTHDDERNEMEATSSPETRRNSAEMMEESRLFIKFLGVFLQNKNYGDVEAGEEKLQFKFEVDQSLFAYLSKKKKKRKKLVLK